MREEQAGNWDGGSQAVWFSLGMRAGWDEGWVG